MKKIALMLGAVCLSFMAMSHEFWLQPIKFWLKVNEKTQINIMVGQAYKGEKSNRSKYKINQLKHYSVEGVEDYMANLSAEDKSLINASFSTPGNHLIAFNNSNTFIELKAADFNKYLHSEGLDPIIKLRTERKQKKTPGRELYQRCVKTLFKVGDKTDNSFSVNTGMRLELIPQQNPYTATNGSSITVKALFDNQPLHHALVLVWHSVGQKTSVKKYRSNEAGEINFNLSTKGRWMISVVHMIPHSDSKEADFQSFWGSYTFGYY